MPISRLQVETSARSLPWLLSACLVGCNPVGKQTTPAAALPDPYTARFVKLEELTEWSGKPWATMAEFNLIDATGAAVDRSKWTVSADSAATNDSPMNAIDGNLKTLWHSQWEGAGAAPPPPHWFVVGLGVPVKISGFRYLPRQDGTANGAIAKYRFYVSDDGVSWGQPVSEGDFSAMGAATAEKVIVFARQSVNHLPVATTPARQDTAMGLAASVKVDATDADGDVMSYSASGLPPGLAISKTSGVISGTPIVPGTYQISVAVNDGKGTPTTVDFSWEVRPPEPLADARPTPGEARFVKLEALTEVDGHAWATMAEFNLIAKDGSTVPRDGWIASADSADTSDKPSSAIDGLPTTLWHSQWDGASPPPPHSFIVDLRRTTKIGGFRYMPRQDGLRNGTIARFRFFTSVDGVTWGNPAVEGDFSTMGPIAAEKTVSLP